MLKPFKLVTDISKTHGRTADSISRSLRGLADNCKNRTGAARLRRRAALYAVESLKLSAGSSTALARSRRYHVCFEYALYCRRYDIATGKPEHPERRFYYRDWMTQNYLDHVLDIIEGCRPVRPYRTALARSRQP